MRLTCIGCRRNFDNRRAYGGQYYEDDAAFGFLNPGLILRAAHLIPCFASGRTKELLPQWSLCRLPTEKDEDWDMFYVNM